MKTDRLYSSLVFSLSLHTLVALVAVLYMMYFSTHHKTVVFDVSLVSPSQTSGPSGGMQRTVETPREDKSVAPAEKPEMVTPKEKMSVNERIAALEAKRKIENMARLRKRVDVFASKGVVSSTAKASGTGNAGAKDYISLISARIQSRFLPPDSMDRDLVATIVFKISRNGNVTIIGFEKRSGSSLFDRVALKSINDAAPYPAPPSEWIDTEIEMTLHPQKGK